MPVQTYRRKPIEVQAILWDGTNTKEVTDLIGEDMLIGVGEYGIGFKLKNPTHYGNDRLVLRQGSVLVKYPNGQMSNAGLYRPEEWELVETKQD